MTVGGSVENNSLTARQEAMVRSERNDRELIMSNKEMLGLNNPIEVDPDLPDEHSIGTHMLFENKYRELEKIDKSILELEENPFDHFTQLKKKKSDLLNVIRKTWSDIINCIHPSIYCKMFPLYQFIVGLFHPVFLSFDVGSQKVPEQMH